MDASSKGVSQPKTLFINDRKQDRVLLRFDNLYYTVSLGFGKGECVSYVILINFVYGN